MMISSLIRTGSYMVGQCLYLATQTFGNISHDQKLVAPTGSLVLLLQAFLLIIKEMLFIE